MLLFFYRDACVVLFQLIPRWFLYCYSLLKDINECETGANECDENANCSNTKGSYTCRCKTGFEGDGNLCQGTTEQNTLLFRLFFVSLSFACVSLHLRILDMMRMSKVSKLIPMLTG